MLMRRRKKRRARFLARAARRRGRSKVWLVARTTQQETERAASQHSQSYGAPDVVTHVTISGLGGVAGAIHSSLLPFLRGLFPVLSLVFQIFGFVFDIGRI